MMSHVAILIPSCGQRALANLARDAIAAFTRDVSHEVWLLDHPPGAPWSENGSVANGSALNHMLDGLLVGRPDVTHVFAMHDDALPLRAGWLSYLIAKPGPVVGVKASERNGYAHASGVLFSAPFARAHSMLPDLPRRDAAEWPPSWVPAGAFAHPHRPPCSWACQQRWADQWWSRFSCDISFLDVQSTPPFYVHFGGGTLNRRSDTGDWILQARKWLGLEDFGLQ